MSRDITEQFEQAALRFSSGELGKVSQNEKLDLYGLHSVVRKGAAPSEGPSALLDPVSFAKWTSWASASHLEAEAAMSRYVSLVNKISTSNTTSSQTPVGESQDDSEDGFGNKASTGFDLPPPEGNEEDELVHDICFWATIGDVQAVRQCLEENISPDYRDQDGLTPLMRAVDRNEEHVVDILFCFGADMNAIDEEGQTALHYAAYCEHAEMAGLLLTYGALHNVKDRDDLTPLEATTGETRSAMEAAINGTWKRKGIPYCNTLQQPRRNNSASLYTAEYIVAAATVVLIAGLIMYVRRKS